jgi:tetratricopeptide (TPR) repeat protein
LTLETVNHLGGLYKDQDKLTEAEAMYQIALAGFQKAMGPDNKSTLETVTNLGDLYKKQGKLDDAEEMYQRTLVGFEVSARLANDFRRLRYSALASLRHFH